MTDRIDELMKDLQNPQYWDLFIKGNARVLQLRQEWDRETCILIRDKIIESLKQNEKLQKVIDEIRKRITETNDWESYSIGKVGVSENQAKFVTNCELKSILSEVEK